MAPRHGIRGAIRDRDAEDGTRSFSGAWDDPDYRADSPARHIAFTLAAETTVTIVLADCGALGGSRNTPPGATYAHCLQVRRANGKLLRSAPHTHMALRLTS